MFVRRRRSGSASRGAPDRIRARADSADLEPITLHECRHSAISTWIAAGINLKVTSSMAGHASISITLDRYGHLLPGAEDEAAAIMNTYNERSAR